MKQATIDTLKQLRNFGYDDESIDRLIAQMQLETDSPSAQDLGFFPEFESTETIVPTITLPEIDIRCDDNPLAPMFVFTAQEGLCVLTDSDLEFLTSIDEVSRNFPNDEYFNVNADGATRAALPSYVHVPLLDPGNYRRKDAGLLKDYIYSGEAFQPVHREDEPVGLESIGLATSVFVDSQEGFSYDLLKRKKAAEPGIIAPAASVVHVSDVPRRPFWITRESFKRLLTIVPGKGFSILKVKDTDCVSVGPISAAKSKGPTTITNDSSRQSSPNRNYINETPRLIETPLKHKVNPKKSEPPLVITDDSDDSLETIDYSSTDGMITIDNLVDYIQEYVNLHNESEEIFKTTLEFVVSKLKFTPTKILHEPPRSKTIMAMSIGQLIEETVHARFGQIGVIKGIGLIANSVENFVMLLQAWTNRCCVAHVDYSSWTPLPYREVDWDEILSTDGFFRKLTSYYSDPNNKLPNAPVKVEKFFLDSGLLRKEKGLYEKGGTKQLNFPDGEVLSFAEKLWGLLKGRAYSFPGIYTALGVKGTDILPWFTKRNLERFKVKQETRPSGNVFFIE